MRKIIMSEEKKVQPIVLNEETDLGWVESLEGASSSLIYETGRGYVMYTKADIVRRNKKFTDVAYDVVIPFSKMVKLYQLFSVKRPSKKMEALAVDLFKVNFGSDMEECIEECKKYYNI